MHPPWALPSYKHCNRQNLSPPPDPKSWIWSSNLSHTLHFTYFCNFTKSFCNLCGRLVWIWAGRSSDFLGTCLCIFTIFCISTESFCNLCGRLVSRGHPLIQSPPQKKPLPPFLHLSTCETFDQIYFCTFALSLIPFAICLEERSWATHSFSATLTLFSHSFLLQLGSMCLTALVHVGSE